MSLKTSRCSTVAAAAAVALLFGCSNHDQGAQQPAPTHNAATAPVVHTYTVRGVVVTVPTAARPLDDLEIRHEHIPDYKKRDGEVYVNAKGVRGMVSMTMGFPVAEGVSLEGIAPGDKVRFVFVTTWGESYPSYEVTEIEKLPPETELNFGG
jgi:hypothetical protein